MSRRHCSEPEHDCHALRCLLEHPLIHRAHRARCSLQQFNGLPPSPKAWNWVCVSKSMPTNSPPLHQPLLFHRVLAVGIRFRSLTWYTSTGTTRPTLDDHHGPPLACRGSLC